MNFYKINFTKPGNQENMKFNKFKCTKVIQP